MGGQQSSVTKIGFQDVQRVLREQSEDRLTQSTLLLSTLQVNEQQCLIAGTRRAEEEEQVVNQLLKSTQHANVSVVVYGKHGCDETACARAEQLRSLGFAKVYWYVGGLFEWLILQDMYGEKQFATSGKELDLLKYMPPMVMGRALLENG